MSPDKPSHNEDEYFAKLDAELIQRHRAARAREAVAAERRSHFMKCPKCGAGLETIEQRGLSIDRCPECRGLWLDHGELELLMKHGDPGVFGRVFRDLFGRAKK
jgi:hypothetical protein